MYGYDRTKHPGKMEQADRRVVSSSRPGVDRVSIQERFKVQRSNVQTFTRAPLTLVHCWSQAPRLPARGKKKRRRGTFNGPEGTSQPSDCLPDRARHRSYWSSSPSSSDHTGFVVRTLDAPRGVLRRRHQRPSHLCASRHLFFDGWGPAVPPPLCAAMQTPDWGALEAVDGVRLSWCVAVTRPRLRRNKTRLRLETSVRLFGFRVVTPATHGVRWLRSPLRASSTSDLGRPSTTRPSNGEENEARRSGGSCQARTVK